ncbi:MAG: nucleotide exchange factor GrpE [Magnetococcales bacterium]|nr:nucleotide exchange factor GrpE [Magnetococcales bacterium]NGZ27293.1 nucleotide exchange factor GrpE [Magnetococcales bacterium]
MAGTEENMSQGGGSEPNIHFEHPSCPLPEVAVDDLAAGDDAGDGDNNSYQAALAELEEKLKAAEARLNEERDARLRVVAEMENMRKRTLREIDNARKFALEGFAKDLLNVADNLERALQAATSGGDGQLDKLTEGVRLIQSEVVRTFGKHGITRLDAVNRPFDPHMHQAMMEVPNPEAAPGTVVCELQAGYLLNERLLRPAMVGVAKTP